MGGGRRCRPHGRGIDEVPVARNLLFRLVEGEVACANVVVEIVLDLVLKPSTTVRNRRIVGFRPQVPRVCRIAADFERNQMVLFIVPRICICVGIFLYLFNLEPVRVIHWRANRLGGPVGIANVLLNVAWRNVGIGGSRVCGWGRDKCLAARSWFQPAQTLKMDRAMVRSSFALLLG